MNHKYYTSYYENYKDIPNDWYCIALFDDAPEPLKNMNNFLSNRSSVFAPSKELMKEFLKNNGVLNNDLEEKYIKEVLNNFQIWKKHNPDSGVDNFREWIEMLDMTLTKEQDWKCVVFMTKEHSSTNTFRYTFRKLMSYNKIEIQELNKQKQSNKKNTAELF